MNTATRILGRAVSIWLGSVLLFPQPAGFSQCPATPIASTQAEQLAISPPKSRVCCIFDWALALDPASLSGHVYGNGGDRAAAKSQTPEPVGYVYTSAAGLVDIGHLRDNADQVLWVYANLLSGQQNFKVENDTVLVSAEIPPDQTDQLLLMAGAIVYVSSWHMSW